ncbi:MAG: type II toxin-antitoxin system PemK/MazF family toxin, partial [Tepidiformaceae bacterium]
MAAIAQGDIYWIDLGPPFGSEPGYRRPFVVVQNESFNRSAIGTVLACAMTTNLRHAAAPGNLVVEPVESGLPSTS